MLVLVRIMVETPRLEQVVDALRRMPEVIDLFEVTGEHDLVALVEVEDVSKFRELLVGRILKVEGIRGTDSSIVLYVHKRGGEEF
ncbi:MAG: hypothetical protein DRO06_02370 [Thermoproteota archaeon]|nr:MAG: hypothetical protein DRO06_02370 [Candidatus Korarchaeota archaeon]